MANEDKLHIGATINKSTHDELRRIAYEQRIPIATILVEGLRLAIDKRNAAAQPAS